MDSIGVNTHFVFNDTVYAQRFAARFPNGRPSLRDRLEELGIRHIRDGAANANPGYEHRIAELANDPGIRTTTIIDLVGGQVTNADLGYGTYPTAADCPPVNPGCHTVGQLARAVRRAQKADAARRRIHVGRPALEGIENPNESDIQLQSFSYWKDRANVAEGAGRYPGGVKRFAHDLYVGSHADPTPQFAALPVVAPAFAYPPNANAVGSLPCDLANMHSYPGDNPPGTMLDGGFGFPPPDRGHIAYAAQVCPGRPIVATETGYTHSPLDANRVAEDVSGRYLPRLLFEYFNRGIARTYLYQLIDSTGVPEFGLLRANGTARPAFRAIRNLTALLADRGRPPRRGALAFALKGDKADVHQTLLRKGNGEYWLAIWLEVPSAPDVTVQRHLTMSFPRSRKRPRKVITYLPGESTKRTKTVSRPRRFGLDVADAVTLVRVVPAAKKCRRGTRRRKAHSRARVCR